MQRAMILLAALTGNQGKRGGGVRFNCWWTLSGFEALASGYETNLVQRLVLAILQPQVRDLERYMTKMIRARQAFTPPMPRLWVPGGLAPQAQGTWGTEVSEAVKEAIDHGWVPLLPLPGKDPKVYFATCGNPLRRWPAPQTIEKNLWPKLELIVGVDFRMSTTALKSDIVLPAAGYYEKRGIKYTQSYLPYVVCGGRAVKPLGEAKGEWESYGLLAKKIQERAREKGVGAYRGAMGAGRALRRIYYARSFGGRR